MTTTTINIRPRPLIHGTAYFVSRRAAYRYYASQGYDRASVDEKFMLAEIYVGKPRDLPPGWHLVLLDNDTRYGVEEPA